ncbi:regulator of G-protein signaling 21-like [Chanos chanos]|uniref:Regulator of G-protein signaling 1 n=1 Tax=Chanos chanos TaxID=29144 RepID=A0A6J2WR42_CHACN|nr:regulator of G-protein signaling 21-like [Chanos chanos]
MAIRSPAEEAVGWGESINKLLESKAGQMALTDFLKKEYSEENILFWLACEEYKKIPSSPERISAASKIYSEFVQVDAPKQINIDSETRKIIAANISTPDLNSFDKAQTLIYNLMARDSYPRFLKSEIYQAILKQS